MDRLQKKCVVASAGFHLLLLVILVVGPAFLASKAKVDDTPILDVIPGKLIDAAFSGGGNPHGTPPPPVPPEPRPPAVVPPAPPPEPKRAPEPEPPKEEVKEVKTAKPDPNSLERTPEHKHKRPDVSTKAVLRSQETTKSVKTSSTSAAADREAQRLAERNKRLAAAIGATASALRRDIAPGTTLEALGLGGGGEVYASYDQVVRSIYWHAWTPPDDTASDQAVTRVTVTIASNGMVLSARITEGSGDASVDRSVQRTLERVTFIAPFPEGAKDKERTYKIIFNLKAKRLSG